MYLLCTDATVINFPLFAILPRAPPRCQEKNWPPKLCICLRIWEAIILCGNDEKANVPALDAGGRLPLWVRVPVPALISG
jgi:hypothetical protein